MRGRFDRQGEIFHTFNLESLVPDSPPLRPIKNRADKVLSGRSRRFSRAYGKTGRKSIPPERLSKALLRQAFYRICSEIQLSYNMLYRWFLDLTPSETVWTPEVFSMNRKRFDEHGFVREFFDRIVHEAILEGLFSKEHFSVDGTLIQSLAADDLRSIITASSLTDVTYSPQPVPPPQLITGSSRIRLVDRSCGQYDWSARKRCGSRISSMVWYPSMSSM